MAERLSAWTLPLRGWQERAIDAYNRKNDDFLLVATPGSGKTKAVLRMAHQTLMERVASRIVVVVPSVHLKWQWNRAARECGLRLDHEIKNDRGRESTDYHGQIVTYSQVATCPEIHSKWTFAVPTLAIFDEIHHVGEGASWGIGLRQAYGSARRRITASGTLWTSNPTTIPFVTYADGVAVPDFVYGYSDAILDRVCRPVLFPHHEGEMEWKHGNLAFKARFSEELSERQSSHRLRTALAPDGEWLRSVLWDAHEKLLELRETDPVAGGLVVCIDQRHAEDVQDVIRSLTGIQPVLAISDETESSQRIENFKQSGEPWIVAVKMVSEGVDIPRLRVGVYATTILTELYFRQFAGRFVRVRDDLLRRGIDQAAHIFIPADEELTAFAYAMHKERLHALEESSAASDASEKATEGGTSPRLSSFTPLNSSSGDLVGVIAGVDTLSPGEIAAGRAAARQCGISHKLSDEDCARLSRLFLKQVFQPVQPPEAKTSVPEDIDAERSSLERSHNKTIRRIGMILKNALQSETYANRGVFEIAGTLTKLEAGISCRRDEETKPSLEQLRKRDESASKLLEEILQEEKKGRSAVEQFARWMENRTKGN